MVDKSDVEVLDSLAVLLDTRDDFSPTSLADIPNPVVVEERGNSTVDIAPACTVTEEEKKAQVEDVAYVRKALKTSIDTAVGALENLAELIEQSEHPQHFSALASIVKSISDSSKNLLETHKSAIELNKMSEADDKHAKQEDGTTQINAVFVGNTTELQEMIKKLNDKSTNSRND